ncbi:hypothetical protein AWV79_11350 [Cupriavidus sp. UYMMa02A]|nr:hypothetical protein AWV79_11350 [Cupriavidus sp. UYMMa02A]
MSIIVDVLVLAGVLLTIVAVVQVAAARLVLPESALLSAIGIAIGAGYVAIDAAHPEFARHFLNPLIDPELPPEAYLWIFLPPPLFHAALTADVRSMLPEAAPILLLAVVAVIVLERPPLSAGGTRWARWGTLRKKSSTPSIRAASAWSAGQPRQRGLWRAATLRRITNS